MIKTILKTALAIIVFFITVGVFLRMSYFVSSLFAPFRIKPEGGFTWLINNTPIIGVVLSLTVASALSVYIIYKLFKESDEDNEKLGISKNNHMYGKAKFANLGEIEEAGYIVSDNKKKAEGIIIGKKDGNLISIPEKTGEVPNLNMMIFGASGTGKSWSVITPSILQAISTGKSAVVVDPKGELYSKTIAAATACGVKTKLLNLTGGAFKNSDSIDMLAYHYNNQDPDFNQGTAIDTLVDIIVNNTEGQARDDFFIKAEKTLISAYFHFVIEVVTKEKNIETFAKMLSGELLLSEIHLPYQIKGVKDESANMQGFVLGEEIKPKEEQLKEKEREIEEKEDELKTALLLQKNESKEKTALQRTLDTAKASRENVENLKRDLNCLKEELEDIMSGREVQHVSEDTTIRTETLLALYAEKYNQLAEKRKGCYWIEKYNAYKGHRVSQDTASSVAMRLAKLQNPDLLKVLSVPDIDFKELEEEHCIYYVITSDKNETYSFISATFFTLLFDELTTIADKNPKRHLKREVLFILDEFPNVGRIPNFSKRVATVRSRGVATYICCQDLPQLKRMYPYDEHASIINNCGTLAYLGGNDTQNTGRYLSERTGETTIEREDSRKTVATISPIKYAPSKTINTSYSKRMLMTPHEVIAIKPHQTLLLLNTGVTVLAERFSYLDHPASRYKAYKNEKEVEPSALDHIPKWVRMEQEKKTGLVYQENAEESQHRFKIKKLKTKTFTDKVVELKGKLTLRKKASEVKKQIFTENEEPEPLIVNGDLTFFEIPTRKQEQEEEQIRINIKKTKEEESPLEAFKEPSLKVTTTKKEELEPKSTPKKEDQTADFITISIMGAGAGWIQPSQNQKKEVIQRKKESNDTKTDELKPENKPIFSHPK